MKTVDEKKYFRLIWYCVNKSGPKTISAEDNFQNGYLGLHYGLRNARENISQKELLGYLTYCITRHMYRYSSVEPELLIPNKAVTRCYKSRLRKGHRQIIPTSMDSPIQGLDDLNQCDTICATDRGEVVDAAIDLRAAIAKLDDKDQRTIAHYMVFRSDYMPVHALIAKYKVSRQAIHRRWQQIRRKLIRSLQGYPI